MPRYYFFPLAWVDDPQPFFNPRIQMTTPFQKSTTAMMLISVIYNLNLCYLCNQKTMICILSKQYPFAGTHVLEFIFSTIEGAGGGGVPLHDVIFRGGSTVS